MELPWDPYLLPKDYLRYSSVTKFKYYHILEKDNYWVIISLVCKVTYKEEYKPVNEFLLDGFVNKKSQHIQVGSIRTINEDDRHLHGYYIVEFTYSPYVL